MWRFLKILSVLETIAETTNLITCIIVNVLS